MVSNTDIKYYLLKHMFKNFYMMNYVTECSFQKKRQKSTLALNRAIEEELTYYLSHYVYCYIDNYWGLINNESFKLNFSYAYTCLGGVNLYGSPFITYNLNKIPLKRHFVLIHGIYV